VIVVVLYVLLPLLVVSLVGQHSLLEEGLMLLETHLPVFVLVNMFGVLLIVERDLFSVFVYLFIDLYVLTGRMSFHTSFDLFQSF
jgi:hypothetical protein